jgi:hypothetical protein
MLARWASENYILFCLCVTLVPVEIIRSFAWADSSCFNSFAVPLWSASVCTCLIPLLCACIWGNYSRIHQYASHQHIEEVFTMLQNQRL